MEAEMPNHDTIFKVVVNHEEQYAIWPDDKLVPDGWRAAARREPGTPVSNGSTPTGPTCGH